MKLYGRSNTKTETRHAAHRRRVWRFLARTGMKAGSGKERFVPSVVGRVQFFIHTALAVSNQIRSCHVIRPRWPDGSMGCAWYASLSKAVTRMRSGSFSLNNVTWSGLSDLFDNHLHPKHLAIPSKGLLHFDHWRPLDRISANRLTSKRNHHPDIRRTHRIAHKPKCPPTSSRYPSS